MATVNRFFRPNKIAQVQPIPLEQLALVPQYMRKQHDAAEQTALENSILQADTLTAQDQELARQFLDPLEKQSEQVIDNLTKNGFSQDIKSDLTGILVNKKKLERDVLGPLKARKEAYQAKVEEIEEFFKDDPEAKRDRLAALQATTFASQSEINPNNGKLKVGAVGDPFYANRLDTSELNEILLGNKNLLDTIDLKYNMNSKEIIQRGGDLWAVIQEKSTSKLDADRIYSTIMNSLGSDVKDSFRMEAAMETGIAGRDISIANYMDNIEKEYGSSQVREVFDEKMGQIVEARKVTEIINSKGYKEQDTRENKKNYLKEQKNNYIGSVEQEKDQEEIAKQMQTKPAIDFLADLKMEEKFKNLSGNMAIYESLTNTKYLAMDSTEKARQEASKKVGDTIPTEVLYGSQGMKSNFPELVKGINDLQYDKEGNLIGVSPIEKYLNKDTVTGKEYYYQNKKTGEVVTRTEAVHPKEGLLDKYERKEASTIQLTDNAQEFKPLQELKKNIPNSQQYSDKQLIEGYVNAVNNSDGQLLRAYEYYDDKGKSVLNRANRNMLGVNESGNLVNAGTAESRSNFLMGDGNLMDFKKVMDELGFEISDETSYPEFVNKVKPRITSHLPQLGKYAVTVRDSEGNGKTILMEPDNLNLKSISKPSKILYDFSKSGKVTEVLDGEDGRPFLPSDQEDKVMVAYNNMGDIFTDESTPRLGYVEISKEDLKYLSGTNLETLINNGAAKYTPQEEIDMIALQQSTNELM